MFCEDIHSALDSLVSRYDEAVVVRDESLQPSVVSRQLSEGSCLWLKGGEAQKKIETVERVWDFLLEKGVTRRGVLVA